MAVSIFAKVSSSHFMNHLEAESTYVWNTIISVCKFGFQ